MSWRGMQCGMGAARKPLPPLLGRQRQQQGGAGTATARLQPASRSLPPARCSAPMRAAPPTCCGSVAARHHADNVVLPNQDVRVPLRHSKVQAELSQVKPSKDRSRRGSALRKPRHATPRLRGATLCAASAAARPQLACGATQPERGTARGLCASSR